LLDAHNALPVASSQEVAMAQPTSEDSVQGLAELAALPANEPVRLIAHVNAPAGANAAALNSAIASAETAARAAGVTSIERMGSQPMIVVEATPAQVRALAQSGAIASVQLDRPAQTQN
jgi:hypothetical protein